MKEKVKKNFTINWFWLYRAFSYDFVFYYTIATLYYTTAKGFELPDVMLLHSITAISTFVLLLPISWIIKKIGNTASIRIGTFLWIAYMVGTIFINNFYALMAIEVLCSIGTIFKILSDSVIIVNTLEKHGQSDKYVKIESRGITTYFVADCISALIAGFLFNVNAHLPMILCLCFIVFSFIISLKIKDETERYKGWKFIGKENLNDSGLVKEKFSFKAFFKNKYFLSFLAFVIAFYGLIMSVGYMQSVGLVSIGFDAVQLSIVVVVCKVVNAFSSWLYGKLQNKIKKHFPIFMPIYFIVLILIVGLIYIFLANSLSKFVVVCVFLILMEFVKQPYKLYAKDYIRLHASGDARQNLYTVYFMCEASGDFLLCLLGSLLLEGLSVGVTYLILVGVAVVPIVLSSIWLFRVASKKHDKIDNFDDGQTGLDEKIEETIENDDK